MTAKNSAARAALTGGGKGVAQSGPDTADAQKPQARTSSGSAVRRAGTLEGQPDVPVKHRKPCRDCPFRRASMSGWTGGAPPEWFTESALADFTGYGLAPCHETATEEQPLGMVACAGALVFARNNCKSPRDPERADAIRLVESDPETVFVNPAEFINHHRGPNSMRSWEGDSKVKRS